MRILCFTSFTFSYINRARVLFKSLRRLHPDWHLVALIVDEPPSRFTFDPDAEPFDELVTVGDLFPSKDFRSWLFKHNVVEACTAVKGPYLSNAARRPDVDAVIYLDPDTCVFSSLDPLLDLLTQHSIVLTPHLTAPETDDLAVRDNEMSASRCGIYNLGFVAIRAGGAGSAFADWWAERLLMYCYEDIPVGIFVDQRWCDHVPALFDGCYILRDPGYNVASWNLSKREVSIDHDGQILVNGKLLRFWHFTKLGEVGDAMTRRYARSNFEVYELWLAYKQWVDAETSPDIPNGYWSYGVYDDGSAIPAEHRLVWRNSPGLQDAFSNPYASGPGSFQEWLHSSAA